MRVHHFLPGVATAFAAGSVGILTREGRGDFWLGAAFGAGAGLTADEFALLAGIDNPYWGSQGFAFVEAGLSALGAGAIAARFHVSGRREGE